MSSKAECKECVLHTTRRCITAPVGLYEERECSLLFITESPSFIGECDGKVVSLQELRMINQLVGQALVMAIESGAKMGGIDVDFVVASIVQCRATNEKNGAIRPPDKKEVLACTPNFMHIVNTCKPKQVIFCSQLVKKFYISEFPEGKTIPPIGFLIDQGGAMSSWFTTAVRTISELIKKLPEESQDLDMSN